MQRERGILMNGEMVRATLEDRKTQTRRPVKLGRPLFAWQRFECADGLPGFIDLPTGNAVKVASPLIESLRQHHGKPCPFGKAGDRLWVRETWAPTVDDIAPGTSARDQLVYFADHPTPESQPKIAGTWRPSIHMPRWASRIMLEIKGVRVEQLQSISEADAQAEGTLLPVTTEPDRYGNEMPPGKCRPVFRVPVPYEGPMEFEHAYRWAFSGTWDDIYHRSAPWAANPWVWVVDFARVK